MGGSFRGAGRPVIVFIARSNQAKPAAAIDALLAEMESNGAEVRRSRSSQTHAWLNGRVQRLKGPRFQGFAQRYPMAGSAIEKAIKAAVLLSRPSRWDYFDPRVRNLEQGHTREVRRLVRKQSPREVYLIGHSVGGIVAALAESEPSVRAIACFGYPFKHPARGEESHRTAHLAHITKPFLIIQGDRDEYGSAVDAQRYPLSSSIAVMNVSATHDFADLQPDDYQACRHALLALIGMPPSDAER